MASGKDLDQLYSSMSMEDEMPNDIVRSVCSPSLTDAGDIWVAGVENWGTKVLLIALQPIYLLSQVDYPDLRPI
jgi:hypothetical protein